MKNFYLLYSSDGAILNKEINDLEKKLDISDTDIIYYNIDDIDGIRISIESDEMGIYKSFNYEIFERRNSIVVAFDGNSSVSNLVQEAKNGKGKSKIYVNIENSVLADKARNLGGYVVPFDFSKNLANIILNDNPEIV